jgi:hypothetical protein
VRATLRLGMFLAFPNRPGYYSFADQLHGDYREQAPNLPYGVYAFTPGSLFDVDLRYLDKPDKTQTDRFGPLKRGRSDADPWCGRKSRLLIFPIDESTTEGYNNHCSSTYRNAFLVP